MKKQFVKPEIKGIRLRENILAGSGGGNSSSGGSVDFCNFLITKNCSPIRPTC